jgi:glycosyltransferase involved in cell wall biosynthesis
VRIVHVNPFFFPRLGGLERRIYHLARLHAARGHEVTVLCGDDGGTLPAREAMAGFEVVRLPSRRLPVKWDPPVQRTRGVERALRDLAPDVVDFHYRWSPEVTKAVVRAGADSGLPWVFTWHNQWGEGRGLLRPLSLLNDRRFRRRVAGAHRIVCVSDYIRRELEGKGFGPARLVTVVNGAVRPAAGSPEWQPDDGRPAPASPYAVGVGRLTPEKGVDLCVKALAAAVGQGADLRLVLCGRGPLEGRLRRLARRLGVADRLVLAGWTPEATKWRLLDGATAYLHLARFESYGISVAEALVAGAPSVVADVGGVREVTGNAALLVEDGDAEAAGAALARLAADPQAREALRRKALARAPTLSWETAADAMERVYAEAAGTRRDSKR